MAFAPSVLRPEARGVAPRGVDLNLNEFDLSEATQTDRKIEASWAAEDACVTIGNAFFASVDGDMTGVFREEDEKLLKAIFNPSMSDRREEGVCFVPPDTSVSYVQRLRTLVEEEDAVRAKRKEHFLSPKFSIGNAGSCFPSAWTSAVAIKDADAVKKAVELHERSDYKAESAKIFELLEDAVPVFGKCTEDGLCFRIYRVGSLEVRTIQEPEAEDETIGVVFSIRN